MKVSVVTKKRSSFYRSVFIGSMVYLSLVLIGLFWVRPASATATGMIPESFSTLAKNASPAVVNIKTVQTIRGGGPVFRHFFNSPGGGEDSFRHFFVPGPQREYKRSSLGSGFLIDKAGYVVTNNHVVDNMDEIQVILKTGKEYDAKIVGRDPKTDIALLKITSDSDLPTIQFGDSDALEVGEWILAIGSPFGLEHTLTAGIVSAKGRVIGSGPYDDFIQTDASINPGNSGGPLLNMAGKVVGINTAIIRNGQGIGFAIPVNLAKNIIDQLRSDGEVTRGWLGIVIQDLNKGVADYYGAKDVNGVLVTDVIKNDPADKAGIQAKDIILSVDGKKVVNSRDLITLIAAIDVGKKIEILVLRSGNEKKLIVKVAKKDDLTISESGIDWLGLEVLEITKEDAMKFNMGDKEGLLVNKTQPDSKAVQAGIRMGDIIKEINKKPVNTTTDYYRAISSIQKDEVLKMLIKSKGRGFIVVEIIK